METLQQQQSKTRKLYNNFANSKAQCLGKRDKSSAGRIDPRVVEVCAVINDLPYYYTTSSCAGRCYIYRGPGIKATSSFERFRVNHDKIQEPERYFDLSTLETDPTGGGDPVRSIGQFDHNNHHLEAETLIRPEEEEEEENLLIDLVTTCATVEGRSLFLRFEPFILHVACRSLEAAAALMNAARPSFKVSLYRRVIAVFSNEPGSDTQHIAHLLFLLLECRIDNMERFALLGGHLGRRNARHAAIHATEGYR